MARPRILPVALLAAVLGGAMAIALPGIAGRTAPEPPPAPLLANGADMSSASLADLAGDWVVTDLAGATLPAGPPVTLHFGAEGVRGFSGCNTFRTTAAIRDGRLSLGALAMTRLACGKEAMTVEIAFVRAMQRIDKAAFAPDGTLTLTGFGQQMMRARRG